jgi:hypothetical protein
MPDRLDGALGPKVDRLVQEADVDWDSRFIRTRSFLLSERERERSAELFRAKENGVRHTLLYTRSKRGIQRTTHTHGEKKEKERDVDNVDQEDFVSVLVSASVTTVVITITIVNPCCRESSNF